MRLIPLQVAQQQSEADKACASKGEQQQRNSPQLDPADRSGCARPRTLPFGRKSQPVPPGLRRPLRNRRPTHIHYRAVSNAQEHRPRPLRHAKLIQPPERPRPHFSGSQPRQLRCPRQLRYEAEIRWRPLQIHRFAVQPLQLELDRSKVPEFSSTTTCRSQRLVTLTSNRSFRFRFVSFGKRSDTSTGSLSEIVGFTVRASDSGCPPKSMQAQRASIIGARIKGLGEPFVSQHDLQGWPAAGRPTPHPALVRHPDRQARICLEPDPDIANPARCFGRHAVVAWLSSQSGANGNLTRSSFLRQIEPPFVGASRRGCPRSVSRLGPANRTPPRIRHPDRQGRICPRT